jgi:integrase
MSNVVVKLFTRPTIKGTRTWVEVNRKLDYPQDTVFILRWLPKGATNYRTKTLPRKIGLKLAQIACARFEPPEESPESRPAAPTTLDEFRTAFLHDKRTTRKKDGTLLDPETIRSYELVTRAFIDITKRTTPKQITKQDMKDWISTLRKDVGHRSVCNLYILVACFLKFCGVDHKTLLPQSERPAPVAHPPDTYTPEEMDKFFFQIIEERAALAYEFLLKTGARKTEMTYCDWDNNLNLGPVPTVKFFTKEDFRVKTGKYREVPLEKELAAKLRAWRLKNPTTRLVFGRPDGSPEDNFLRTCKETAERADLDRSKFWLHKFRDTYATWALRRGADIRTVQHWLGHASIEMTQKYLAPQEGAAAQSLINRIFGNGAETAAALVQQNHDDDATVQ